MRDTARAPQPPTNPPKGHQMSQQGLDQNEQKCQIRAKLSRSGVKNPNFTGESENFVTHIAEDPPRHLVCIVFWSGMGQNGHNA